MNRSIVLDAQVKLTVLKLITKWILQNDPLCVLSNIIQFRTVYDSCREWFERLNLSQGFFKCKYGNIKNKRHILTKCVYHDDIRQTLRGSFVILINFLFMVLKSHSYIVEINNKDIETKQVFEFNISFEDRENLFTET